MKAAKQVPVVYGYVRSVVDDPAYQGECREQLASWLHFSPRPQIVRSMVLHIRRKGAATAGWGAAGRSTAAVCWPTGVSAVSVGLVVLMLAGTVFVIRLANRFVSLRPGKARRA